MELVSKIFETLEISQLALLQLGLVVVLAFLLSTLLIRPILRTFEERENLSVKPVEESRRLLADADEKARGYDEALRKGAAEALARCGCRRLPQLGGQCAHICGHDIPISIAVRSAPVSRSLYRMTPPCQGRLPYPF